MKSIVFTLFVAALLLMGLVSTSLAAPPLGVIDDKPDP
jgi:hypothetical protein